MPQYTHTTFAALKTAVQERLGDTVFWTDAEVGLYIREALRVWGALTFRWKDISTFAIDNSIEFYDLYSLSSQLAQTVTDQDLLEEIQYHLLETINRSGWSGTTQFTLATVDLESQINETRGAIPLDVTSESIAVNLQSRVDLTGISPHHLEIRRAAYQDASGSRFAVWRTDEQQAYAFQPDSQIQPGQVPVGFSTSVARPLEVVLIPPAGQPGILELLVTKGFTGIDFTGNTLGVPDDLAWVLKYATMADMLSREGMAEDTIRAAYCDRRAKEGLEIAKAYASGLNPYLDGRYTHSSTLQDLDAYTPNWQNESGVPTTLAWASYNLFTVHPRPDSDPHSVLFDLVLPAPIPTADGDFIQVGRDELDSLIDYAHHIAAFKQGGLEFENTMPQYEKFLQSAAAFSGRQEIATIAKEALDQRSRAEDLVRPVAEER